MSNINARLRLAAAIAMLLIVGVVRPALAQSSDAARGEFAAFEEATRNYALMHRRLEGVIGPLTFGMSVDAINRNIQELAAAIRAERTDARAGDLLTPVLAKVLRVRVNTALIDNGHTAAGVLADGQVAGIDYRRVDLRVNDTFPWILGVQMFPCVIEALPPLPPELQYRVVAGDLVLIDVHASLIVDVLRNLFDEGSTNSSKEECSDDEHH